MLLTATHVFDFDTANESTPPFSRWVADLGAYDHCRVEPGQRITLRVGRSLPAGAGVQPVALVMMHNDLAAQGLLAGPVGACLEALRRRASGSRFTVDVAI